MTRHCFWFDIFVIVIFYISLLFIEHCLNSFQFWTMTKLILRCLSWWWLSLYLFQKNSLFFSFFSTNHSLLLTLIYQISVTNKHTHDIVNFITRQKAEKIKKSNHHSSQSIRYSCFPMWIYLLGSLWIVCVTFFWIHISWRFCQNMFSIQFFKNYWFCMKYFSHEIYPILKHTHTHKTHTLHNSTEEHTHICFGQTSFKTTMWCEQTTLKRRDMSTV